MLDNVSLIDAEKGIFMVLGMLRIYLPESFDWHVTDFNDIKSNGVVFLIFDKECSHNVAQLMIVDASNDPTEPDISTLIESDITSFDKYLYGEIKKACVDEGIEIVRWKGSELLPADDGMNCIFTTFVEREQCQFNKEIQMRFHLNGRKFVMVASFDLAREARLTQPVYQTMVGTEYLDLDKVVVN